MENFINLSKVDGKIIKMIKEFIAIQILLKEYSINPTDENLEAIVQAVETTGVEFEVFKQFIVLSIKEISTGELDIEGKVTENGIELI